MPTLLVAPLALFVLLCVGPALGRGALRILRRVPALGAVAALGALVWLHDPSPGAEPPTTTAPLRADRLGDHPADAVGHVADDDLVEAYLDERARYARAVAAARARALAWLEP